MLVRLVGVRPSDHDEPFQNSAMPESPNVPTATHMVRVGHDTPLRSVSLPTPPRRAFSISHRLPFHRSASGRRWLVVVL